MKALFAGVMLLAASAQAQDVSITVGKTYTIPYVAGYPGAYGVAVQVNATHDSNLVIGLASNVVIPTDNPAGSYATYSDHYYKGQYYFIGMAWAIPAEAGVLPIRVLARRAGTWDLQVKQCALSTDAISDPTGVHPTCVDSVTHIIAEDAGGVASGQLERAR
jgi:hypothetical protein